MVRKNRYCLLGLFLIGFVGGILYANLIGVAYLMTEGIFHEYFLSQYTNQEILKEQYFLYLVQQRLAPVVLLMLAGMTKARKIFADICMLWTGFAGGMLAVAAVMRMGIAGMVYYAAAILPQSVFYVFAYLILICFLMDSKRARWNISKSFIVLLSLIAGILTEVYVNPHVMHWVMRIVG